MKRLLSVLMICLLLIQLSACGLNSEEKDTGILYLKNPIDNSVTEIKVDSEKVYFANGEMLAFESSLDVYEMVETLGKKNPNYFFAAIDDKQLLMVNLKDNNKKLCCIVLFIIFIIIVIGVVVFALIIG